MLENKIANNLPAVNGGINPAFFQWADDLKKTSAIVNRFYLRRLIGKSLKESIEVDISSPQTGSYWVVRSDLGVDSVIATQATSYERAAIPEGLFPNLPADIPVKVSMLMSEFFPERYDTPERQECAAIAIMVNQGFTRANIKAVLEYYGDEGFYQSRAETNRDCWLDNVLEKLPAESKTVKKIHRLRQALAGTSPTRFAKGANGRDDKQIVEGILEIAEDAGTLRNLGLPLRRLSIITGLPISHISRGIHRLRDLGILELEQEWKPGRAARYNFNATKQEQFLDTSAESRNCSYVVTLNPHDIFTIPRLGGPAQAIYFSMKRANRSLSINEIAKDTGFHPNTVRKYLLIMSDLVHYESRERFQMVKKIGSNGRFVKYTVGPANLDDMAQVFKVRGVLERRLADKQTRYSDEREKFKLAVADLRKELGREPSAAEVMSNQLYSEHERKNRIVEAVRLKRREESTKLATNRD